MNYLIKLLLIVTLLLITAAYSFAATIYVDGSTGNDGNDGSSSTPVKTISVGIAKTSSGDTIQISAGTYTEDNLNIIKSLTITGAGPTLTKIETTGDNAFEVASSNVAIKNLYIGITSADVSKSTNGDINGVGNGIYFDRRANPKISGLSVDNIIINGKGVGRSAVLCNIGETDARALTLSIKNFLAYNFVNHFIAVDNGGKIEVINATLYGSALNGIGIQDVYSGLDMRNTIIANCTNIGLNIARWSSYSDTAVIAVSYSLFYGNGQNTGGGYNFGGDNLTFDPLFIDALTGNFHVQSYYAGYAQNSSIIDAGDPTSSYSNEPSPNGGRVNMGYFGNSLDAEQSYTPTTRYVNITTGSDVAAVADGTSSKPWKTITYALGQAKGGDTITVAAGTYSSSTGETLPLNINKSLSLQGTSKTSTIIEGKGEANIISVSSSNVTLSGFTLKGIISSGQTHYGADGNGNGIVVQGSSLTGISISEIIINGQKTGSGGILVRSASVSMKNMLFYDLTNYGGFFENPGVSSIENITINNCRIGIGTYNNAAISLKNSIISNNTVFGFNNGGATATLTYNLFYSNGSNTGGSASLDSTNITSKDPLFVDSASGNFYLQSKKGGYITDSPAIDAGDSASSYSNEPSPNGSRINIGLTGNTTSAESKHTSQTLYVSGSTGNDSNSGSSSAPFKTITKAVSTAVSGDTISVSAGTYIESGTISKSLTLNGAGESSTIVIGTISISASDVTITGFTIQSEQSTSSITSLAVSDFLIKIEGVASTLNNLKFSSNTVNGLSAKDYGIVAKNVKNIEISNNTIKNFKKKGISIKKSSKVKISNNKIENNKNDEKTAAGIETVEETKEAEVSNNGFEKNDTAVNADNTVTQIDVKENDFKDNTVDTGTYITPGEKNDTDKDTQPPQVTHKLRFSESGNIINVSYVKVNGVLQLKTVLTNMFDETIKNTANTADVSLILSSTGGGKFYSDVSKAKEISSVIVPANSNSAEFYYSNSTSGSNVLTASENPTQNIEDASMALSVLSSSSSNEIKTVLNNPNPFNPDKESTKIQYDLNEDKDVTVFIYDTTMTLIWQNDYSAGSEGGRSNKVNEITWDGKTYFGDICANDVYIVLVVERGTKKLLAKGKIAILK
jgi:parallel beta-helix repeat protein